MRLHPIQGGRAAAMLDRPHVHRACSASVTSPLGHLTRTRDPTQVCLASLPSFAHLTRAEVGSACGTNAWADPTQASTATAEENFMVFAVVSVGWLRETRGRV